MSFSRKPDFLNSSTRFSLAFSPSFLHLVEYWSVFRQDEMCTWAVTYLFTQWWILFKFLPDLLKRNYECPQTRVNLKGENRKLLKNWERGHEFDFDDFLGVGDTKKNDIYFTLSICSTINLSLIVQNSKRMGSTPFTN